MSRSYCPPGNSSTGACRPPRACRPLVHVILRAISSIGECRPNEHATIQGLSSIRVCCPPGHVVHRGILSTGACCPPGHDVHQGMLSTGESCLTFTFYAGKIQSNSKRMDGFSKAFWTANFHSSIVFTHPTKVRHNW